MRSHYFDIFTTPLSNGTKYFPKSPIPPPKKILASSCINDCRLRTLSIFSKTPFGPYNFHRKFPQAINVKSLINTRQCTEFLNLLCSLFWFRSFAIFDSCCEKINLFGVHSSVKNGAVFLDLRSKILNPNMGHKRSRNSVYHSVLRLIFLGTINFSSEDGNHNEFSTCGVGIVHSPCCQ